MTRRTKNERKHVFRSNLQAFMKQAKFDKNSLAARLDLDRDGRKWLGRLLSNGLDRTNSKSEPKLQQLCECIGLESTKQLWDANLKLTASDDFHIEALKKILKEGGSPARNLRYWIEGTVEVTEKASQHLQAFGDLLTEDQERVAIDLLYDHLRASPNHSLDGFWSSNFREFISQLRDLRPLLWQRLYEHSQKNDIDLAKLFRDMLGELEPKAVYERIVEICEEIR